MKPDEHVYAVRAYLGVYAALVGLLMATVAIARLDLGAGNAVAALVIGAVKAVLIVLVFMNARFSPPASRVFAGVGFFWLGILLVLTMGDIVTRGWVPSAGE